MVKRFHCEFKHCNCCKYELFCSGRCKYCNHSKIWHSLKEKPPKATKSQFFSLRKFARKPIYVSYKLYTTAIFTPTPIPIVNAFPIDNNKYNEINFCVTVEALPV